MKTFAVKEKRPAAVGRRPYVHAPLGPAVKAQQVRIGRILRATGAQAKLTVGQPNDRYEQEAARVADQVMAMPDLGLQRQPENEEDEEIIRTKPLADRITPLVQRQEESPEEEEEGPLQTKKQPGRTPHVTPNIESRINSLKGGGQQLDPATRNFFEPRFGRDFSQVRIHNDEQAADMSRSINARAFTLGKHVVFGPGQYQPQFIKGRRLLGHELTHVVQQMSEIQRRVSDPNARLGIHQKLHKDTLAGAWQIVQSPRRRRMPNPLVPNGRTDEQLLLAGFREICPLATISSGEISVPLRGAAPRGRRNGCRCLREIERRLPGMKTARPPATIQVEPNGWSSSRSGSDPARVTVRHPDDPFSWGYWTNITEQQPYERRHQKAFWQTLAHEVCGHVWTFVRTGGTHAGGRGGNPRLNPRGHDPAIERENLLAGEHGVTPAEQRGFQYERGARPATEHAGESFIVATISGFQHGSVSLAPTNAASVIRSASLTVALLAARLPRPLPLFVELEGFAFANEGGRRLASSRSSAVMRSMLASGISRQFIPRGSAQRPQRFRNLPGRVSPGRSLPSTANPGRNVKVFLFHNPRSAQHGLLPAKVFFNSNKAAVRSISLATLNAIAAALVANPNLRVRLIGRADSVGRASYNLMLAKSRAKSVAQELLNRGVNAAQIISVTSQGETRTRARSRATRWQDRHVEIRR